MKKLDYLSCHMIFVSMWFKLFFSFDTLTLVFILHKKPISLSIWLVTPSNAAHGIREKKTASSEITRYKKSQLKLEQLISSQWNRNFINRLYKIFCFSGAEIEKLNIEKRCHWKQIQWFSVIEKYCLLWAL